MFSSWVILVPAAEHRWKGALTFWTAAFPGLARDLPEVKQSAEEVSEGHKTFVDFHASAPSTALKPLLPQQGESRRF